MGWLEPRTLRGLYVTLEQLDLRHHDDLEEAVKDGELWKLWYTFIPEPKHVQEEIERRLGLQAKGTMLPFAVIENATQKAVGMTTFMNVDEYTRRVEIGSTWYRKRVQRTPINTESKLMLLTYAFEELDCMAVEFRTHFFNHPSRQGIERLGAKLDGILRNHSLATNGTMRDTCVYSIIDGEWPTVKANLHYKLNEPRKSARTDD